MTVEETIEKITKNSSKITDLIEENKKLTSGLLLSSEEDWDWVSVQTASRLWDISLAKMYQRINRGKLKTKRFDNKIYVSLKDVKAINDEKS